MLEFQISTEVGGGVHSERTFPQSQKMRWLYIFRQMTDSSHWLFFFFSFSFLPFSSLQPLIFSCSCHCRFISLYKGPCHTHKVQRLNESTSYTFRIQAFNEAGEGPFSDVYTFTTPRSPPVPMKGTVAACFFPALSLLILFSVTTNPMWISSYLYEHPVLTHRHPAHSAFSLS